MGNNCHYNGLMLQIDFIGVTVAFPCDFASYIPISTAGASVCTCFIISIKSLVQSTPCCICFFFDLKVDSLAIHRLLAFSPGMLMISFLYLEKFDSSMFEPHSNIIFSRIFSTFHNRIEERKQEALLSKTTSFCSKRPIINYVAEML
jgi:hypothetical protein